MTEPLIFIDSQQYITTLTMNRAKARNSLSEALMTELASALDEAQQNPALRVVILAAQGPAFCAGHDLKELTSHRADADQGRAFYTKIMGQCSDLMQKIVNFPRPVIACVEGIATAAGCQLVASCDLAVAGSSVSFATPGVDIGLFCSTPMVALSRNVARKHAMSMLLTGEPIDADTAQQIGLINEVVEPDLVRARTGELAALITRKPAATVAIGKAAFYQQLEKPLNEAYEFASEVMVTNMMIRDAEEGIGAFVEKRSPSWVKDDGTEHGKPES
ncbi:MAG: enoyl-CoA hydratase [Pseudomonadota bacterium]